LSVMIVYINCILSHHQKIS